MASLGPTDKPPDRDRAGRDFLGHDIDVTALSRQREKYHGALAVGRTKNLARAVEGPPRADLVVSYAGRADIGAQYLDQAGFLDLAEKAARPPKLAKPTLDGRRDAWRFRSPPIRVDRFGQRLVINDIPSAFRRTRKS